MDGQGVAQRTELIGPLGREDASNSRGLEGITFFGVATAQQLDAVGGCMQGGGRSGDAQGIRFLADVFHP
jgi:hypothetical protein